MEIININLGQNETFQLTKEGTYKNPIFRASEVAKLLGIVNVHDAMKDFTEKEKLIQPTMTTKGF